MNNCELCRMSGDFLPQGQRRGKVIHDMNNLEWIQNWFAAQCDGDWEHRLGVTIESLDNPGWKVVVGLEGTVLEGVPFAPVKVERSEHDWLTCRVRDKQFEGFGGPGNLAEILDVLRSWSENTG
jgi:hypothetical protein